jgi:hypothetical protein
MSSVNEVDLTYTEDKPEAGDTQRGQVQPTDEVRG